jgi:hypothetical protein
MTEIHQLIAAENRAYFMSLNIKLRRLEWAGHVHWMQSSRIAKNLWKGEY